ncbi:MAG: DUF4143 domain-containing protein, partial [Bacteroidales bacterium]|nr:DUF4143 domain-containing protein [Bacteroidales bacterium]
LELLKHRFNQGLQSDIYFWRDNKKNEIDCIVDKVEPIAIEIKSGKTFTKDFLKMRKYWQNISAIENNDFSLVYGGEESFSFQETNVYSWRDLNTLFTKLENQTN